MDPALDKFVRSLANSAGPPNMTRVEAHSLARLLNRTLNVCTSRHIQQSTTALIKLILPWSHARAAVFDYVTSLSVASKPRAADAVVTEATARTYELEGLSRARDQTYNLPSSAQKRLHALYTIHNVFFALRALSPSQLPPTYKTVKMQDIEDHLADLITRLWRLSCTRGEYPVDTCGSEIMKLFDFYLDQNAIDHGRINLLRTMAERADDGEWQEALDQIAAMDEEKAAADQAAAAAADLWTLPHHHGAAEDPWYDLPAANGLHMRRTLGSPLRAAAFPEGGYNITNGGQEADQELKREVTSLKDDLLHALSGPAPAAQVQDIDPLGNIIHANPALATRNPWGFSLQGVKKIKELESSARRGAGYAGVPPLRAELNPFSSRAGGDVRRAQDLASRGGRGGRGGGGVVARGRGGLPAGSS
ncbi:hypothetical protein M409DRAFT_51310 [Zasmidium cellare ATCC 36951]|uniref:Uncharacterized protein n=1 Tax=Zasmidium cellare ATCC 36951 TaxID=1080233 RepID=A0A6A6CZ46_ZASCE|nr:uncharacterized protein M409DRAFT_51310 [Zasmidium cellare ATCC 36951]KAF2171089.1 hypothetical protein M409DRAFT_51310 [Zasmidium cellare ATCC 36951]